MELLVEKIVGEEEEKGGGGTVDRKSKIRIRGREEAQKKTLLRPDFECNQTGLANELCLDELIHYEKKRILHAQATLGRVFGNLGGGVAKGDNPNKNGLEKKHADSREKEERGKRHILRTLRAIKFDFFS